MTGGIAIFVKTPGYSALKTRLAAVVGAAFAAEWHGRAARTVAAVAAAAARDCDATLYWAVAEPEATRDGAWSELPNLAQGEGGLGARMGRVHAELVRRHGAGVLLGADTPQLDAASLRDALRWLQAAAPARQVLGPARDGGFWLYGGNRATSVATWESVPYSRSDTATRFEAAFAAGGAWLVLPRLTDVDHDTDLADLRSELAALPAPAPAQRDFAAWLEGEAASGRLDGVAP